MSWKEERGRDPRAADPVMVEDHEPTNGTLSLSLSRDAINYSSMSGFFHRNLHFPPNFLPSLNRPSVDHTRKLDANSILFQLKSFLSFFLFLEILRFRNIGSLSLYEYLG